MHTYIYIYKSYIDPMCLGKLQSPPPAQGYPGAKLATNGDSYGCRCVSGGEL